ncbi:MAG: SacI restriction endonuclease [Solidesulfovibrio magneticus str. Maddingley MBC34]|uniref:SacI restriction endonuclease n=1 Tax=Solidesulfovibrio magneticus str. Maddingley MBC34 TaxID=1206767 RepID=K6FLS1_9BACT|nr:MAG: SacI restriction endonuclease [Solidesulfovibrio magneticus str. Maddingley MBC34]
MKIDKASAAALVREEAAKSVGSSLGKEWIKKSEELSRLCEEGVSKTHIAFLGTAMLAKAMNGRADLFAIKPDHAPDNPNAFSARTLCHTVLVPLAAELGFSIGVTGREPLNNQPYFRMTRLDDGTPVHAGGKAAFDYMMSLVRELQNLETEDEAREALCAFIAVRRGYQPRYVTHNGDLSISPEKLTSIIKEFVRQNAEGGKRAQAVVAGLLDVFAGVERVESGRINDPSRKYPGDVCVRSSESPGVWEKAIEVRDKPVAASDVQIFGNKCVAMGVREAALVMVSDRQQLLDVQALAKWADNLGIGLTLFQGWEIFVDQALFWATMPKPEAARLAVGFIHQRLVTVEALPEAIVLWERLLK